MICFLATSCGFNSSRPDFSALSTCSLSDDQVNTIMGKWPQTPVPIAFHTGDFSAAEENAIMAAADVWNAFYQASGRGNAVIDYGTQTFPYRSGQTKQSDVCAHRILTDLGFVGRIVIYKTTASWAYGQAVIALTTLCKDSGSPYPAIYGGMSEVNFQNYFVSGQKQPDLTSIYVHELGHLIGIDHSCDADRPGFPSCVGAPDDYLSAVMYPGVKFNGLIGEPRRQLNVNDKSRANCVL